MTQRRARPARGSRLALVAPLLAFAAAIVALALAGSHGASHRTTSAAAHPGRVARPAPARTAPLEVRAVPAGTLPAAVQDPAVAPVGSGRLALLGGIDAADTSTDAIVIVRPGGTTSGGSLPSPQHDAQAARLGNDVYVFGGGEFSQYDHILRYDPVSAQVTTAGALPTAASDVAVGAVGGTAYIVGGYDGVRPLDTVLAWRPGDPAHVVARLSAGVRYAAVAAVGNELIIAGGTDGATVYDSIFSFYPTSGALRPLGRLPFGLAHASAAVLDGQVLIVGGRRQVGGDQSDEILAIDPVSGRVRVVGRLPAPLSDAAVASDGARIVVAGGESPAGVQSEVIELVARRGTGSTSAAGAS
jgi:hypothetical protein